MKPGEKAVANRETRNTSDGLIKWNEFRCRVILEKFEEQRRADDYVRLGRDSLFAHVSRINLLKEALGVSEEMKQHTSAAQVL